MELLDQGTIIYGLRCDKYPEVRCSGIIITASCDIAQSKVSKLYYLPGMKAEDWFCSEHGFRQVYKGTIDVLRKEFSDISRKYSFEAAWLQRFSREEALRVLADGSLSESVINRIMKSYDNLVKYDYPEMTKAARTAAIRAKRKPIVEYLKKIGKGEIVHYYYLPEAAFTGNNVRNDGLIIDLQEIGSIPLNEAKQIINPGIDFLTLPEFRSVRDRLKALYWLENETDFVTVAGAIASPWREHLMQRFSNSFILIGLDGATDDDYRFLSDRI